MAARLLGLRLALLLNTFRARPMVVVRRLLGGMIAVLAAFGLAWLPGLAATDAADRVAIDTVFSSVVLAGAILVPFFVNRGHLEPRQFGGLPVRPATVAASLLVTTPVGWPVLWLLVWLVALAVLRPERVSELWVEILFLLLVLLLAIVSARVSSALSKLVIPSHRSGLLGVVGTLLLLAVLPVGVFATTQALQVPGSTITADAASVLGWTPFGAPAAGFAHAAAGDLGAAATHFGIAAASVLLLTALWFPLVRVSLERIDRPVVHAMARTGLGWFERVPARPAWVIGARALSYWARDPRYRVGLLAIPFAPVVMLAALWVAGVRHEAIAFVPLPVILLLLEWSLHNDVATDSTAIWMHVASGTRGRHDRAGRLLPVMIVGVPLAVIGSSVSVTVAGDWRVLPAVLGMNLAVLFVACGVAAIFSARMPYPTTRPGDSPFAQPAVGGSGSGAAQTLSMLCAAVLALPPVLIAVPEIASPDLGGNAVALLFGLGYGLIVLIAGVLIGGRIFTRAGPELVAITQTFD